jgi:hypothetical protein
MSIAIAHSRSSLAHRWVDPASSLGEVLFGLIMTLTFTLGAGIILEEEGREGARQLLIALIGCNIAWGIIDGAFYLGDQLFERGRLRRLGQVVRGAPDVRSAATAVAGELDELLEGVTTPSERETLYTRIATNVRSRPPVANTVTKEDLMGAFTSFWLVVIPSLPAAIPFLLIDDARFALRVSNAVLLAILFVCGYWWARYTLARPLLAGFSFLIVGIALVVVAIALGG